MRKFIIFVIIVLIISVPVSAMDFTAPSVPDEGKEYMPADIPSFGEGLWYVVKSALNKIAPTISESASVCFSLIAAMLLVSVFRNYIDTSDMVVKLISAILVSVLLLKPTNSMIKLGVDTVQQISEYGKLLLPVMTAALAAQGAVTSSAAL